MDANGAQFGSLNAGLTDRTDSGACASEFAPYAEEDVSAVEFRVDCMRDAPFSLLSGSIALSVDASVARGGQGEVFHVTALSGGVSSSCALKVFASRDDAHAEWDMLVAHEDDLTVPSPYAVGIVATSVASRWALLMEFIEGVSLADMLAARPEHAMTIEEALAIMAPIVRFAANCCHSRRADVHRDIKPSNIIVDARSTTRLLDFGIASNVRGSRRTCGTEFFAAPEIRFSACGAGNPDDARVDTYGIAATLYAMTLGCGKPPEYNEVRNGFSAAFLHDASVREMLAERATAALAERFSVCVDDATLDRACCAAFACIDDRIADALLQALSFRQKGRPSPAELERMLPLDANEYEYRLVSEAVQECLRLISHARVSQSDALAAESGRDFIDALDAFNAGRYGEAVPILRAHAARGNAAATYYLGVCVRDGLGVGARDLAQAAWLFSEAAKAGNMLAQNAFGRMLVEGAGVPCNEALGAQWIAESACDDAASGRCGFGPAKAWLFEHGMSHGLSSCDPSAMCSRAIAQ